MVGPMPHSMRHSVITCCICEYAIASAALLSSRSVVLFEFSARLLSLPLYFSVTFKTVKPYDAHCRGDPSMTGVEMETETETVDTILTHNTNVFIESPPPVVLNIRAGHERDAPLLPNKSHHSRHVIHLHRNEDRERLHVRA